jgi:Flp pilus assembly protein TadD
VRLAPTSALAHHDLGSALAAAGSLTESLTHFREAMRLDPDDVAVRRDLGAALLARGRADEAVATLAEAVRLAPADAEIRHQLGLALAAEGRVAEAMDAQRHALRLRPGWPPALERPGGLRAPHGGAPRDDGAEAALLAEHARQRGGRTDPAVLDTLAAAYARAGRGADAVATARHALGLARAAGRAALAQTIAERLALYEAGRAYSEPPQTQHP